MTARISDERLSAGSTPHRTEVFRNCVEKCYPGGIPALFYYKDRRGRKPVVFMQHSAHFLKEELSVWCHRLAAKGYFVVALDARWHGERVHPRQGEMFSEHFAELLAEVVVGTARDVSAVIDFLEARRDADTSRIGMAGFSMGGWIMWGTLALEPRITCAASVVSAGSLVELAEANRGRQKRTRAARAAFRRLEKVDAVRNADNAASRPILMLNGAEDRPMVEFAERTRAAVEPVCRDRGLEFRWISYPGVGHKFTPEMEKELYRWLGRHVLRGKRG